MLLHCQIKFGSQQDSHGYETHDGWYGNYNGAGDPGTAFWGISCRLQTSTIVTYNLKWGGAGDRVTPAQLVVGFFPISLISEVFQMDYQVLTRFDGGFRAQGAPVRCVKMLSDEE